MNSKKKNILIFVILFLITNFIFLPWLINGHMSTDSYNISNIGYQEYNKNFSLLDGRFIVALGTTLMDILDIPIAIYTSIILEIALLLSCISVMMLKNIIEKWKKPKTILGEIVLIVASYYTIFHFLYIENLHFIECGAMSLSLSLYILAARQIVEKDRFWMLKTFIQLCIGLICYQGTISMFVLSLLVFSICKGNSVKQIVKDFFYGMLIALAGILVNQLSIKIVERVLELQQGRDINLTTIGNNVTYNFSKIFIVLKNTGYLIPQYSFLITLGITELIMIVKVVKQNKEKQENKNVNIILEQFAIISVGIAAGFIVSVLNTSGFWAGRARFSIGALIGFLWIHLWVKTNLTEKREWINTLLIVGLLIYGLMNSLHYITAVIDHNKLNELVKEEVMVMQKDVLQYEEEKQVDVTKIAIVVKNGKTTKSFYPQLRCYGNIMMSSGIKTQWSAAGCYNYYTNSKLNMYEPTEIEKQEYLEQNKEYLCMGDTLYITTYMH